MHQERPYRHFGFVVAEFAAHRGGGGYARIDLQKLQLPVFRPELEIRRPDGREDPGQVVEGLPDTGKVAAVGGLRVAEGGKFAAQLLECAAAAFFIEKRGIKRSDQFV